MNTSCIWKPKASNGKTSKLFTDLNAKLQNRDAAKRVWAFTQTDMFRNEFTDIDVDENGEPTIEAINEILNLDSITNASDAEASLAKVYGIESTGGKPVVFDSANEALERAQAFNERSRNNIATVEQERDSQFSVTIDSRNPRDIIKADRDENRRKLNLALLDMLERAGFSIDFFNDPSYSAIFNPLFADKNADLLKRVIRVANNEEGAESLPEEVAHLVIAGLQYHQLMSRINTVFTDDVVKKILGRQYDIYARKYKNGRTPLSERLRREAQAKVLARVLKGETNVLQRELESESIEDGEEPVSNNIFKSAARLLKRLWDAALGYFGKIKEQEVDSALADADSALMDLSSMIQSGEVSTILDRNSIMAHEKMYELSSQTEKLVEITQQGEIILAKKLDILKKTQSEKDTLELRQAIARIRDQFENEQYAAACYEALMTIGDDIKQLMRKAEKMGFVYNNSVDLATISSEADIVNDMYSALQAYTPFLETLSSLDYLAKRGDIDIDPKWSIPIVTSAKDYMAQLRSLKEDTQKFRFAVLKQLVLLYYGEGGQAPEGMSEAEKAKWESVDTILSRAKSDIGWVDANLFSCGDSRSPLLNIIHKIISSQQANRNNIIYRECAKLQEANAKLQKEGINNDFIYVKDSNGVPNGFFVAPVDMMRFFEERDAYVAGVDANENLDFYERQKLINQWEEKHTEEVVIGKTDEGEDIIQIMPKAYEDAARTIPMYAVKDFQKGWTQAQKDYYNTIISIKAKHEAKLPEPMRMVYAAPQVRRSVSQMFDKGGRGALGTIWSKWKGEFSIVDDNPDYGNTTTSKMLLDFKGEPIKRVPLYYINRLDDMRDLSTDATRAMMNFVSMAVNYSEMGKLAGAMRLMQQHVKESYEVEQTNAGKTIIDSFKALGRGYEREYTKTGESTNVVKAILKFIDRNMWNETKNVMGSVNNPFNENKPISKDSIFNIFMRLTSISRMGLNPLSGITNVTQGETQMICEATSGRYFDVKDLGWSKAEYSKLLADYMANFNSIDRHDKMYMLINQFNSSEDFFRDMKDRDFNKSAMKRVMGRGNIYFLNTMGEHYLHTSGMLMVLHHEKVRRKSDPDKVVSLYDVIKQVHDKDGWHLELDDDIEFVDKNRSFLSGMKLSDTNKYVKKSDRDKLFTNLALYINNINAGMHGGYSEVEKGNANQMAIWRAILQFRQWMMGMYNKLYARPYYDAVKNKNVEGSYYTIGKFIVGTLHDMKNMSIKMAIEKNKLSKEEWQNASIALAQSAIFVMLTIMCRATAGWKDKDERSIRLLAYSMRRLEMETGALVPFPPTFIKNVFTLVQSPAAGVKTLENISQLFDLVSAFDEIQSGRYKGWNRGMKALWTSTPLYNIQKLIDMDDYNYMFNIFS